MKKIFNKFITISIATCILFLIVGIILMFYPDVSLRVISYLIAGLLLIIGLVLVYNYKGSILLTNFLTAGALAMILGTVLLIYPNSLVTLIPIMVGIWMLINGIISIQISITLKKVKYDGWIVTTLLSIMSIVCGSLIIINPQSGAEALTTFLGIMLVIYSVTDIMNLTIFYVNTKKIVKLLED